MNKSSQRDNCCSERVRVGHVLTTFISFSAAEIVGKLTVHSQFPYAFIRRQRTSFSPSHFLSVSLVDKYIDREVDVDKDMDIRESVRLRKEIGSISFLEDAKKPLQNPAEEKYTVVY